ncbi:MAG TPA: hypothetical protein VF190_07290, partial [Rhodothermales bacterium]
MPAIHAFAQAVPDTLELTLPALTVEAARAAETAASAPFAVGLVGRSEEDVAVETATSLQDVLAPVAGVWIN